MGKPRKDSWKKLGMDLAKSGTARTLFNEPTLYPRDAARFITRARALRKGANRGKA